MIYLIIALGIMFVMLIALFIFILFKQIKYRKISNLKKIVEEFVSLRKIETADSTLKRIEEISKSNDKYINVYMDLQKVHEDLELWNKVITDDYQKLQSMKIPQEVEEIVSRARVSITNFDQTYTKFNSVASQVTHQDEYLRNEFAYYQRAVRKINKQFKEKRIMLEKLSSKIVEFKSEINDLDKLFNKIIKRMDVEQASDILKKYSVMCIQYAKMVDQLPSLLINIDGRIPRTVEKLNQLYIAKKKELRGPLDHIGFKDSILNVSKKFIKAKEDIFDLKVDEGAEGVREVLRGLKTIEKSINFEIESRNQFIKLYEPTILEIKKNLKRFTDLKFQFKKIAGGSEKITTEIFEIYNDVNFLSKKIDKNALKYRELMLDKSVPYSSKISRTRLILKMLSNFVDSMNKLIESIWSINLELSLSKNKFYRSEAAINELLANLRDEKVVLSKAEEEALKNIDGYKEKILAKIQNDTIDYQTKEQINKFNDKVIKFYSAISGKLQIALHVKNMLKELAPSRSLDTRINSKLLVVEKQYMQGRYAEALNGVIEALDRRK